MKRLKVVLIDTNPGGQDGSMSRYSDLLRSSLINVQDVSLVNIRLALPYSLLIKVPARLRMWAHHFWIICNLAIRRFFIRGDIYHVLDGSHGYITWLLPKYRTIVTAHDIIPLLQVKKLFYGDIPGKGGQIVIRLAVSGLQHCRMVVCVSNNTRLDLKRYAHLPDDRLSVIFPALSDNVSKGSLENVRRNFRPDSRYVFHIGHNGFYKNRAGVLRIFSIVAGKVADIKLVLAGPPLDTTLIDLADKLGIASRLEIITDPDDEKVRSLYKGASLLMFPSIYEGFGWPPIEAMVWGCPVVCSSEASIPEVVGNAAIMAPADDEASLADQCTRVLLDPDLAEGLVRKGYERIKSFKPEVKAGEWQEIYKRVAA